MKNIYILLTIVISSLFIYSCGEEFLDSQPLTDKNTATYYSTPEEAYEALAGCYDGLQRASDAGVPMTLNSIMVADLCFTGFGAIDPDDYKMLDEHDKNVEPNFVSLFWPNWQEYYIAIYRANLLIKKIGQIDWSSAPAQKNIIEGEARFLRAYLYFDIVRMFENIPLLTEPTVEYVPQADPDDVYKTITEDLLFAINNCSKDNFINSDNNGHANRWAAEALLARVYLYYTGYYQKSDLVGRVTQAEALAYLEDLISTDYYGLLDNFYELWPAAQIYNEVKNGNNYMESLYVNEANKEIVFGIKYTYFSTYGPPPNTDGNHWSANFGLRGSGGYPDHGYGQGWGGCTVVPEFYETWDTNDVRREYSVIDIEKEGIDYDFSGDKEYTGYFIKKYTPVCDTTGNDIASQFSSEQFWISQFQDYYSIRYSDVLLMAAELGSSNALQYVNEVRDRAGLYDLEGSLTKDIIFNERKYELAFEGQRYWDLLRYDGKDNLNYAASHLDYNGTILRGGTETQKIINGNNIKVTKGLWQIPKDEIILSNDLLQQNEGW